MEPVSVEDFFRFLFDDMEGYLCIAELDRNEPDANKQMKQRFFRYPQELPNVVLHCEKKAHEVDLYFTPALTVRKRRKKQDFVEGRVAWADGDDCPLDSLLMQPSAVVRSSRDPDKYHFYWKLDRSEPSDQVEYISKRIARYHKDDGMDQSGWDLGQLLRVPQTYNHKYTPPKEVSRAVIDTDAVYSIETDFDEYPEVAKLESMAPLMEADLPDKTIEEILLDYRLDLNSRVIELIEEEPSGDWSGALWELEATLFEAGLTKEEVYLICEQAGCNKFKRNKRPPADLWKDVQRAEIKIRARELEPPAVDPQDGLPRMDDLELLTDKQRLDAKERSSFVERYTEWAKKLGDAAPQYHPAGAFIILSTIMSGSVKIPTSFGTIYPNLWFMILADTTLTRKSTAMDYATELLLEVDPDLLMATDGSLEGLLTVLSLRPGKPSLFLRDEITGLIEGMSKKEYLAGMMETLTKLYDGKQMKRILRRETIDVKDPRLIIFGGGIRSKMMELLDYRHVSTGFLPRFVFVTAESDITRLRPVGPPKKENYDERRVLIDEVSKIYQQYNVSTQPSTNGSKVKFPKEWNATLTDEAWKLCSKFEIKMTKFAQASHDPTLVTPMMARLFISGLKASVLLAASRLPEDEIVVSDRDIIHGFFYAEQWIKHAVYIIRNIGTSSDERKVQKIFDTIKEHPDGIARSDLSRKFFLQKRELDTILATLDDRNVIRRRGKGGRGERIHPL